MRREEKTFSLIIFWSEAYVSPKTLQNAIEIDLFWC